MLKKYRQCLANLVGIAYNVRMSETFEPIDRLIDRYGGKQTAAAAAVRVAPATLAEWRSKDRPVPVKKCVLIEQVSGGAVSRKDLRPDDWGDIWPELALVSDCAQGLPINSLPAIPCQVLAAPPAANEPASPAAEPGRA
jgi:DNA-binding transcriptional regulator YdaS (Cro superfamily)